MANNYEVLTVDIASERLKGIVSENYQWPETPDGYQLEFILHPDGSIIMDFLNEDLAMFWSEAADQVMLTPFTKDGSPITWQILKQAKIPFMS